MKASAGKRVLMLLENYTYPQDGRVRREASTLIKAGYQVSVICPAGDGQPLRENVNGVQIFRYPALFEGDGILGYLWEYVYSMTATFFITVFKSISSGFDIIHAHNPPDTFVLIAAIYKLFGKWFVFDHHDLSPEMYCARFPGNGKPLIYQVLLFFERLTFRLADHVISTNQSYKRIALERGGLTPAQVTVVRNGPELDRVRLVPDDPILRQKARTIIGYVGVMGYQDGVDYLIRSLAHLVNDFGYTNFYCVLIGKGDAFESLKVLTTSLGLDPYVWFTGRVSDEELMRYLSTADICVVPDPLNPFTDRSSMIKITEYMTLGKPIVAFDLTEHRATAGEAASYARPNDEQDFAEKIKELIDAPESWRTMGDLGRERIEKELSWKCQERYLLSAYSNFMKPKRNRIKLNISQEGLLKKVTRQWLLFKKEVIHSYQHRSFGPKKVVFIVGCQRSGTTLLTQIFERDLNARVYPEISELSSLDVPRKLRLNPLSEVKKVLDKDRATLIVLKPLVESQNTHELMLYFEGSKAIWLYRNYKDVSASHVMKWGGENSIRDLRAIVDRIPDNWRYENVTDDLRDIVLEHFSEDMPAQDAAALYWYVRNRLFFELQLDQHPDVYICKYESLVLNPLSTMQKIYQFLGCDFAGEDIVSDVHSKSIKKGHDLSISPSIDLLCQLLQERMDTTWEAANGFKSPWNAPPMNQFPKRSQVVSKD